MNRNTDLDLIHEISLGIHESFTRYVHYIYSTLLLQPAIYWIHLKDASR